MDAHAVTRAPFLLRADLLVREILLALTSEAKDVTHPLVSVFGFDRKTFTFLKEATASSLLKLSSSLVKANAINFTVNEQLLCELLGAVDSDVDNIDVPCPDVLGFNRIYSHKQVVRELVLFMADSLSNTSGSIASLIDLSPFVRRKLSMLSANKLQWLAMNMVKSKCIQFQFDKTKVKDRSYSHMRYEHREGIKDLLISKKATYGLMSFLFTEENDESVRARRYRLGVAPLRGRPKTAPLNDYTDFIVLWTSNQGETKLERFLMAHRKFGFGFDVLWALYQKAKDEGDFSDSVLGGIKRSRNLACQTG